MTLAKKLRADLNSHDFLGNTGPLCGFSFSAGISRFPEDGDSADLLIGKADQAMYRAKHSGKNRVHLHSAG